MPSRPFWSTLYERDLDLVLLDLLHSAPGFRTRLLTAVAPELRDIDPVRDFSGAWHSVTDDLGESDLEAEWRLPDGGTFTLLVEDKLAAHCQPDQAKRYLVRAERYRGSGRATQTLTLLVAPSWYPSKHRVDVAPFERHLAIEEIAAWCDEGVAGERGAYLASLLRHALARVAPVAPSSGSTAERLAPVYALLREALAARGSDLRITSSAEWVYFDFPGRRKGAWLRYRLYDHWVELVLAKKDVAADVVASALARAPLPGASLADRGTTETALWHPTPEVDLNAELPPQRDRLLTALAAAEALRSWYLTQSAVLHATITDPSESPSVRHEVGTADSP
ncbi:MAG TPA: hypothetical protein VGE02_10200 [Gemmatimonadales bacterium]